MATCHTAASDRHLESQLKSAKPHGYLDPPSGS